MIDRMEWAIFRLWASVAALSVLVVAWMGGA